MPIWRQPPQPTQPRPKVIESVDDPIGGRFDATRVIWAQPPQPIQRRVTKTLGIPIGISQAASNIGSTTARINGKISDDGGEDCEARFRWRGSNLLTNPSFEIGDPPEDWEIDCGVFTRSDEQVKSGLYSGKLSTEEIGGGVHQGQIFRLFDAQPLRGKTVSFGCWIYATVGDSAFVFISDVIDTSFSDPHPGDSAWHFISVSKIIDENTNEVYLTIWNNEGDPIYLDDASCPVWTETSWQNTLETNDTYYEDLTGLTASTEYEFQTQAKNSAGEGEWSSSEYFTTLGGQPTMRRWGGSILPVGAQRIGKGW